MITPIFMMLFIFIIFMFLGLPISFNMLFSGIIYLLMDEKDLYLVVHRMFTGIDTFTLMAIPFFMVAGELMVYSGTAKKLLNFSNALVGRFSGIRYSAISLIPWMSMSFFRPSLSLI